MRRFLGVLLAITVFALAVPKSTAEAADSWRWSGPFYNSQCTAWKPVIYPYLPVLGPLNVAFEQKVCTKDRERYRLETLRGRRVKHVQVLQYTDVYAREVDSIGPLVYHGKAQRVPGLSGPGEVIQDYFVDLTPQPAHPGCAYHWTRWLRSGAKGEDVRELQRRLNKTGAHLSIDGDFGKLTRDAVRVFQRARGLEDDGIVGPKTQAALNKVCR